MFSKKANWKGYSSRSRRSKYLGPITTRKIGAVQSERSNDVWFTCIIFIMSQSRLIDAAK